MSSGGCADDELLWNFRLHFAKLKRIR